MHNSRVIIKVLRKKNIYILHDTGLLQWHRTFAIVWALQDKPHICPHPNTTPKQNHIDILAWFKTYEFICGAAPAAGCAAPAHEHLTCARARRASKDRRACARCTSKSHKQWECAGQHIRARMCGQARAKETQLSFPRANKLTKGKFLFSTHLNNRKFFLSCALNCLQTLPTPFLGTVKNLNPFSWFAFILPQPS